jgi:Glycosyl transferase family 2
MQGQSNSRKQSIVQLPYPSPETAGQPRSSPSTVPLDVSVVIPCLNEAVTLGVCIRKASASIRQLGLTGEVVVADNGSIDGSVAIAEELGARVVHASRKGYGSALTAGCQAARGRHIIIGDADDTYDFSDLEGFVEKLRAGNDLVMGTRLKGKIKPGAMPWMNRHIGNPLLTGMLRLLFGAPISDAHCGMRAFSREAFDRMGLRTPGMEFASEMIIRAKKLGMKIAEVPITFYPDSRDRRPHLRPWRDGWRHVKLMLMFSPTALFLAPGIVLLFLGFLLMGSQLFAPSDGPLQVFGLALDFHWAILGSALALVGYQLVLVHFFARIYSVTHRIREPDAVLERGFRILSLDRVLLLSVGIVLLGATLDGIIVARWVGSGGPFLAGHTRLFILGSTLLALGLQTLFNAFFFSILGDAYKYGLSGDSVADRSAADRR